MPLVTGEWRFTHPQDCLKVVEILIKTKGVSNIQILPGRIVFQHQPWSNPDLFPDPLEASSWTDKLNQIDLRAYKAKTLLEGIIFGWVEFRKLRRYATHVCAWSTATLLNELFPVATWVYEQGYYDTIYGLVPVEMRSELAYVKGTVIMCGGPVLDGGIDNIDMGLVIKRGGS